MRKLLQLRFTFILVPAIILLLVFLSGFTGKTASADNEWSAHNEKL